MPFLQFQSTFFLSWKHATFTNRLDEILHFTVELVIAPFYILDQSKGNVKPATAVLSAIADACSTSFSSRNVSSSYHD